MPSNLPKYAKTEQGMIVFSNCINHADAINRIFGEIEPLSIGFIKFFSQNEHVCFELFQKKKKETLDEPTVLVSSNQDCRCLTNKSKYILTSSRFIIFPNQLSHKHVANTMFTDFIIQGAGEVTFQVKEQQPHIICSESLEYNQLHIEHRDFDSKILEDAFDILI